MKAIVLTYDKYHRIADHMIHSYMTIWPDNPLIFRIPYQEYPTFLEEKYKEKVEFIKTDSNIKDTLLSLIKDLDDDEWIYWCMDDRYPISMKVDEMFSIYNWIINKPPIFLSGVMFSNFPKMMHVKNIMSEKYCIYDNRRKKYYRRKSYAMIWMHQFLRVIVLKKLFNEFPDEFSQAKQMDHFKKDLLLPAEYRLYIYSKSIAEYGESTHRGKMTLNCADSFRRLGMDIPPGLEIGGKQILIRKKNRQLTYLKFKIEQLVFILIYLIYIVVQKLYRNEKSINNKYMMKFQNKISKYL